ncbi:MAG: ATP-binding protein, partial [Lachnospiraceae bacterium]|nr:ATP-binding protein [Lachnospiraceae bacterium]
ELHGIGLVNIKHVAESYEGTVDWDVAERMFILAVMLKVPSTD